MNSDVYYLLNELIHLLLLSVGGGGEGVGLLGTGRRWEDKRGGLDGAGRDIGGGL